MFCVLALGASLCMVAPGPGPGHLLQPGPNLLPGGRGLVTVSPRAGYFGPPARIGPPVPYAAPNYDWPAPRSFVPPPPSAAQAPPPVVSAQTPPALRAPGVRRPRPPVPCPDGCPREPDDNN
jgi:hypothetical protein